MNDAQPVPSPWKPRIVALMLTSMALVVPWWAITWPGVLQFQDWPSAAIPFGLNRILVVHLLAAAPFSFWLAWRIPIKANTLTLLACVAVGLLMAFVSWQLSFAISAAILRAGGTFNFFWRTLWVLLLQIPWVMAVVVVLKDKVGIERPFWTDAITAVLLLFIPWIYVGYVLERQQSLLQNELGLQQEAAALRLAQKLAVVGDEKILSQDPAVLLSGLQQGVLQLQSRVEEPLPPNASRSQRLQRAHDLFRLGDFESMKQLIGKDANTDPMASYRMALGFEAQRKWVAATRQFRATIRLIEANADPAWEPVLRSCIERLANNMRRAGEYAEAENMLLGGLENQPELKDTFLLQLGFHYKMAGRTNEAANFFAKAADENEAMRPRVEEELGSMVRQPEGCLLRATPGATR